MVENPELVHRAITTAYNKAEEAHNEECQISPAYRYWSRAEESLQEQVKKNDHLKSVQAKILDHMQNVQAEKIADLEETLATKISPLRRAVDLQAYEYNVMSKRLVKQGEIIETPKSPGATANSDDTDGVEKGFRR
ncbi:uncharacterized protein KY384_000365 [Bacidia gigantensis]|uniref:uncharacterized protein n=1 Tax=Bacidia gigantensis TaxID=2732470 RepID=UPI001D052D42|nr:uncharacterized protein KY384_000365 [Bacidia gigantensis]KAG8526372.1 hypothetical protein KY384_000365 [Bacidia gigantensis]